MERPEIWGGTKIMRIPEDFRRCVAFIGIAAVEEGRKIVKFGGTGFLVSIPAESDPKIDVTYLVTARHVADAVSPKFFVVRLNRKDGSSGNYVGVPGLQWWLHPSDPTADVAVIPMSLSASEWDFRVIPTTAFVTDAMIRDRKVGLGDNVIVTGLFAYLAGTSRNIPIIRTGALAMIPEERITTQCGDGTIVEMDGYLVESRSIGGLSGSPVFVRGPSGDIYFLGLVHGHWNLPEHEAGMALGPLRAEFRTMNMGINIVVPAIKVLEAICAPEITDDRNRWIRETKD